MDDLYTALLPDEDNPEALMRARLEALRGQSQGLGTMGTFMSSTGGESLQRAGQAFAGQGHALAGEAAREEQLLERGQDRRLTRALEAQRLAEEQRYHTGELGLRARQLELGKYSQGPLGVLNTRTGELEQTMGPDGRPMDPRLERKRQEHLMQLGSPPADWEWDPKVLSGEVLPPNAESVKNAGKVTSAAGTILDFGQRIGDFLDKHPNGVAAGHDATAIEPFIQGMQVMARAANDMGVYRAYDKPLLDKIIQDPTTASAILGSATGARDLRTQLKAFLDETKQRAASLNQQVRWRPVQGGRWAGFQPQTAGAAPQSQPGRDPRPRIAQLKQLGLDRAAILAKLKEEGYGG